MREPDRISSRHIGFVDVLGVVAAVLLGVQSLNFIVTLISNFSATFMIFGYESGGNAIVGMLGVLLLLVFALIPAALSGFPGTWIDQILGCNTVFVFFDREESRTIPGTGRCTAAG